MGESEQVPGPDQHQDQGWAQQEIKVQLHIYKDIKANNILIMFYSITEQIYIS